MRAGTVHNGRTLSHIFEGDTVTSAVWQIQTLFMDNNARPHRTAEISDILKNENIECMEMVCLLFSIKSYKTCLGCSKQDVSQRNHPPQNMQELNVL